MAVDEHRSDGATVLERALAVARQRRRVRLLVFVDGRRATDPGAVVLHAHQHIVVAFGRPGQAPTTDATPFPPGL